MASRICQFAKKRTDIKIIKFGPQSEFCKSLYQLYLIKLRRINEVPRQVSYDGRVGCNYLKQIQKSLGFIVFFLLFFCLQCIKKVLE
jgi:hypothetical protein